MSWTPDEQMFSGMAILILFYILVFLKIYRKL